MTYTPLVSFAGCLVAELSVVLVCIAFNKFKIWKDMRSMSLEIARGEFVRGQNELWGCITSDVAQ